MIVAPAISSTAIASANLAIDLGVGALAEEFADHADPQRLRSAVAGRGHIGGTGASIRSSRTGRARR